MNTEVYDKLKTQFSDYFLRRGVLYEKMDQSYYNELFKGKEIYIWGTGGTAKTLIDRIPSLKILAFIDSNHKEETIRVDKKEIKIILPSEMKDDVFCIVASIYYEEIKAVLENMG